MLELLKIKYLGHQPAAKITSQLLDKIITREYPGNFEKVKQKLELINSDTLKSKNRFSAAVLKLSNGDLARIDYYIEMCNIDVRDVISQAEYPERFKFGFEKIDPAKLKRVYLNDWMQYSNWVNKDL